MSAPGATEAELARLLGDDAAAALAAERLRPRAATVISGLPSDTRERRTLRLLLEDGRVFKVRRHSSAERARAMVELLAAVAHPQLPAARLLCPAVSLEDWVEGTTLAALPLTRERVILAADLLADLHHARGPGLPPPGVPADTVHLAHRVDERLSALGAAGALAPAECERLRDLSRRRPPRAHQGVVHSDFCGENLVEDHHGRVHAVDNGGVGTGFAEFDLARTRHRWSLDAASWDTFLGRYRERGLDAVAPDLLFWRLAAVLKSAHWRRVRLGIVDDPSLDALRRLGTEAE